MPDFGWMERSDFRDEIEDRLRTTAAQLGMERYERAIVDRLMEHLAENRRIRIIQESIKSEYQQRTKSDALNSVKILIEDASKIAKGDGRKDLSIDDFNESYNNKYCLIWPFC